MTREQIIRQLTTLISSKGKNNEKECGELLKDSNATSVLLPLGATMLLVDAELRTSSGDVDLLVCSEVPLAGGDSSRRLYVWELKAPQVSLFQVESHGRAAPTKELYSAENQLIHYHRHLAESGEDRRKFQILSPDDVLLGGIIIGTSRTFVKKSDVVADDKAQMLAAAARDIRDRALYRNAGIRLLTWDTVLDNLSKITASHKKFDKAEETSVSMKEGPEISVPNNEIGT